MRALAQLSARELVEGYRRGAFTPLEVVDALAERIEKLDPLLGAFTTLCLDRARVEAQAAGARYRRGAPIGALDGVPLAVKDLYDTAGVRTTYGSAMFAHHVPDRDAELVRRARAAGAIVTGKTQTHEFAWGITSVNATGTARNPWDTTRVAGGSSGGSAVALAADLVPLALGTDTGGSIRIPSAFCGTAGLKPTYGALSRDGIFPLAPSLDHAGPMARTPADLALLFAALLDPAAPAPAPLAADLAGVRVGVCPDLQPVRLSSEVEAAVRAALDRAAALGAHLVELELPEAGEVTATYTAIQRAEALRVHRRAGLFPARGGEYGADVRRWLELATEVTLEDIVEATAARERLRGGFVRLFGEVELLLSAVCASSPIAIGAETMEHWGAQVSLRELVLGFTVPQDLAGLPTCALRAGFDGGGRPIGVQLTGPPGSEQRLLRAADALFAASGELQSRRPALDA